MSKNLTDSLSPWRILGSRIVQGLRTIQELFSNIVSIAKLVAGLGAVAVIATGIGWWMQAFVYDPQAALDTPFAFTEGPTVDVDSAHPALLKSYFETYLPAVVFDQRGNQLTGAPADSIKRLGFRVHYEAVPAAFGQIEVRYYFAERAGSHWDPVQFAHEQHPIHIETIKALQGRRFARFFFVERPRVVSPGERIYIAFYKMGAVTKTGQQETLVAVVPSSIDGI